MLALIRWFVAAASLLGKPTLLAVPDALLQRTTMPEPSGLVWSPALSRYIVISDDTGKKESGTNHIAWLFTVSREGAFDAEPLPISGLDKLNDAEAICPGPSQTFFLTTSHSANKKGQDKVKRRRLYQLALSGRALKIVGELDLADAITASGLLPSPSVDIEALSFHRDELYIGLKSPQNAAGAAYILKVRDVLSALKKGTLAPSQVQVFAQVPLQVEQGGAQVIQGISDMSFLPDGSLALLANSPKKMPHDGGGALWLRKPDGSLVMLRRFVGLKPEGVTLSHDGKSLLIVFDNDRKQPLWIHIPLQAVLGPKSPR